MRSAGIDIGSRTVKAVILEDGELVHEEIRFNTHDVISVCREMLDPLRYDTLTATGYGRHLLKKYYDCRVITEIRAVARGVAHSLPGVRNVLDIGGQDTKVVSLDPTGAVLKFDMNDKCAAGTGKFLEIMATALTFSMEEFIEAALKADETQKINAMCTVFAESEVISMLAKGLPREPLALGIHEAVAVRAAAMINRLPVHDTLGFVGGVARNRAVIQSLKNHVNCRVVVPENPQISAALGCAVSQL